jgi:hypothetical protein
MSVLESLIADPGLRRGRRNFLELLRPTGQACGLKAHGYTSPWAEGPRDDPGHD